MRAELQTQPASFTLSFPQRRHDPERGREDLVLKQADTADNISPISRGAGARRS